MQGRSEPQHLKKKFLHIANWKMNKTIRDAVEYVEKFASLLADTTSSVWLAVPFTAIHAVREKLPARYSVGAQNMNDATSGAFTGEVAGIMIKEAGGDFVILGHSERRQYFKESDEFINRKVLRALESSLCPVLCIGEKFEERQAGSTSVILKKQLTDGLKGVAEDKVGECIIAYEPIWAIGTGATATPELVQETHGMIKTVLAALYNDTVASHISILYGGSVSVSSSESLAQVEGVDGFLIGTASLNPEIFAKIIHLSENVH